MTESDQQAQQAGAARDGQSLRPQDHPLRARIAAEVHARPFESMAGPLRVSHLAVKSGERHSQAVSEHLARLCEPAGITPPAMDADFFRADIDGLRLRWERHTEFRNYTFTATGGGDGDDPFSGMPVARLPGEWLRGIPGQCVAAAHLVLEAQIDPDRDAGIVARLFDPESVVGSEVLNGAAVVWTDFRLHGDGFSRILVQDRSLTPRQTGRLVQTILEIETYRLMALLAFPLAREVGADLRTLDIGLGELTDRMPEAQGPDSERLLLAELSDLAARLEQVVSRTGYRFGAAKAYYALIQRRIEGLRERPVTGLQSISEFMERRLAPAMNTCLASEERQAQIAKRLTRAGNLLRTRVDVAMEAQNVDLLQSMDRRSRLQLRLQETVEGLSILVLSYYGAGLFSYFLTGLDRTGWLGPLGVAYDPKVVVGLSVPVIAIFVWVGVRLARRRFGADG
ncbi:DUF3422 domain-containing protein [Ectothiorhodospiraceae bacterium WFHF3C12]|nr:DUF3422 domain-containing protein [Ectothiorhodospiraceae bacterium WFHF3C12]